jgi:hypothetical protein
MANPTAKPGFHGPVPANAGARASGGWMRTWLMCSCVRIAVASSE